jgi:tRNA(adenine34) deaminase
MTTTDKNKDIAFMKKAILLAKKAFKEDEVPIGAIIVKEGKIIARGSNKRNKSRDATDHAEIIAIKRACKKLGDWRLNGAVMYVTLEPCAMCAGAAVNARLDRVVFGAYDNMAGCCGSVADVPDKFKPNHTTEVTGGVLAEECSALIKEFFNKKRKSL